MGAKFGSLKRMPSPIPSDNTAVFKRKLSDAFIRSLTECGKHADGEVPGLYLEVRASSKVSKSLSKVWRLKYRLHGKENRFSIGAYPDIGLKEARDIARGALITRSRQSPTISPPRCSHGGLINLAKRHPAFRP